MNLSIVCSGCGADWSRFTKTERPDLPDSYLTVFSCGSYTHHDEGNVSTVSRSNQCLQTELAKLKGVL